MSSSYQPQALSPEFQPREIASQGATAGQRADSLNNQLQTFQGQLAQRAQNRLEDQQYYGKEAERLAAFSKSALKFTQDRFQQAAKDKEIGDQYATLYNTDVVLTEELQALVDSQLQEGTYGQLSRAALSEGQIAEAEALRAKNRLGEGVTNERALLLDARSRYMPEMTKLLNGSLAELYNEDPGAAIDIANRVFIEKYGLQYTTKANFVSILGDTMRNQSSMFGVNKENQLAEERRKTKLAEGDRITIQALDGLDVNNAQVRFQELTDLVLKDNNGINTRGAANARVAQQWLTFAASTGNEELLAKIGATPVIANNFGTTISRTYPTLFWQANKDVVTAQQNARARNRFTIITQLGEALEGKTGEERRQALLEAQQQLRGDPEGQRQLNQLYGGYNDTPETRAEADRLSQQIAENPTSVTAQSLQQSLQNGEITPEGFRSLVTQLNAVKRPVTSQVSSIQAVGNLRFREAIKAQANITIDPQSGSVINPEKKLNTAQVSAINKAYTEDLQNELEVFAQTLDPTLSPAEIRDALAKKANEFYERETSAGGRYYFNGLFDGESLSKKERNTPEDYNAIIESVKAYNGGVRLERDPDGGVTDWSLQWSPSQGGKTLQNVYKPGDILFTRQEIEQRLEQPSKTVYTKELATLATRLRRTPRQLLQDSASRYQIQIPIFGNSEVKELLSERKGDKYDDPMEDRQGPGGNYDDTVALLLPAFMSEGLTLDGAAVAAAIFRYYAQQSKKDLTKDSNFMQTMMQQLRSTGLYEVLSNPRATQKQLVYSVSKSGLGYKLDWMGYSTYYRDQFLDRI